MAGGEKGKVQVTGGTSFKPVWAQDAEMPSATFADQLQITRIGDVYHLTFGQMQIVLGQLLDSSTGKAPIVPTTRVIVSRGAMERMAALFVGILEKSKEQDAEESK